MSPHKVPKRSVNYRQSRNLHKRCGNCRFMLSDGLCQLVLGYVEPMYVCDEWEGEIE